MTSTVADLIKDAMRVVGALAKSETPASDEMTENLRALNLMLGSWSARHLMLRGDITATHVLTPNLGSYTIGPSCDIDMAKPIDISEASIRSTDNDEFALSIVTSDLYFSMPDRLTASGRPNALFYDPGPTQQSSQSGTIYLNPIPEDAETLILRLHTVLSSFDSLVTEINFEPPYQEAIKYSLACRLWREYHGSQEGIPVDIVVLAAESLRIVENMNAKIPIATCDLTTEAPYDIYNG